MRADIHKKGASTSKWLRLCLVNSWTQIYQHNQQLFFCTPLLRYFLPLPGFFISLSLILNANQKYFFFLFFPNLGCFSIEEEDSIKKRFIYSNWIINGVQFFYFTRLLHECLSKICTNIDFWLRWTSFLQFCYFSRLNRHEFFFVKNFKSSELSKQFFFQGLET